MKEKEILNMSEQLKELSELGNFGDRKQFIVEFRKAINELINVTPTSELRNRITELNILFESIVDENIIK